MKFVINILALFFVISGVCREQAVFAQSGSIQYDTMPKQAPLNHPIRLLLSNLQTNNYLNAYLSLKEQEQAYMSSSFKVSYLETMSLISAYIGELATSAAYDSAFRNTRRFRLEDSHLNDQNLVTAATDPSMMEVAKKEQVVMINEEHRFPQHRAFTGSLLQLFYNEGFRYLALETLTAKDSLLQTRGYATQQSGFYSADPVYAAMVRDAIRIGYTIVPYEWEAPCQGNHCDNEREKGQALNIYERILKREPQAKILVHVGRAHNAEIKENDSTAFMAWHFREITGIDPFTVDQLFLNDNSGRDFQRTLYQQLIMNNAPCTPVVVRNADGSLYRAASYDMHILHPPNAYVHRRPAWLERDRGFKKINVEKLGLEHFSPGTALIQAITNPSDLLEIPVDQVLFKNEVQQLLLPKGRFLIRAVNRNNEVLGTYWEYN